MTISISFYGPVWVTGAGTSLHWQSDFIGPLEPGSFIQIGQYTNVGCTDLMYWERVPTTTTSGDVTLESDPTLEHAYGNFLPDTSGSVYIRIELHGPSGQVDWGENSNGWASYQGQTAQIIRVVDGINAKLEQIMDAVYVHFEKP